METYYLRLVGPNRDRTPIETDGLEEARNEAVRYLGRFLSEHPGFAEEGHWQLNVENASGQSLVHVIIATVVPRGKAAAP
ncbi:DUF6894 family protein [uncultured Sphingomonas sp.]|jgi:hypothetical protein|uniref:DUF6894 family protein n=1 Tax=uncultured Sphingomonas sp. TaxID=158754 RepID=UPI0035CA48D9